jgi:protocatechuate 3,4-dioxygenase beta subunit
MKITQIEQRWNRRRALELLGAVGAGVVLGCGDSEGPLARAAGSAGASGLVDPMGVGLDSLSCILTPALDQGPFFVDEKLERSDLVAGETAPGITRGSPLILEFGIFAVQADTCAPLTGAVVDIWHADVDGLYSDTASGFIQATDTTGEAFLRAYQVVGADGVVRFRTIYPGWYATRTIHVHVKIRTFSPTGDTTLDATTQVFFDDSITDALFAGSDYLARGPRSIPVNTNDQIFNGTGVGRAIDTIGPLTGQARPGELALAELTSLSVDGKPGHLARIRIGVQVG